MMTIMRFLAQIKKSLILSALIALVCTILIASGRAATWNLSGTLATHDPTLYKEGSTWWIFETNSSGIGVKYSPDGHAWTQGGSIFAGGLNWWKSYNGNSNDVWAPDIHDWNGRAICFYSVSTFGSQKSAIGLTTASSIATGNWTDQGAILTSGSGSPYNAIDPNFIVDASGQPWLAFGSFWNGIYIVKLDPNTLKPNGTPIQLASDSHGIEGSYVVYNSPYYYLFVSKGTCCNGASSTYHICYGRSSSITGPYVDQKNTNMLSAGGSVLDTGSSRYIAPGGQSIYGNNVIARHELDSQNNYIAILFISDLYWSNGWPTYTSEGGMGGGGSIANGTYKIINRNSGLSLDAYNWGTGNGTVIDQYTYGGGNNQHWNVTSLGSGLYSIVNVNASRALDVTGGNSASGTWTELWDNNSGSNQQWAITATSGGYYKVSPSYNTGLALDVYNAYTGNYNPNSSSTNGRIDVYSSSGNNNQQWAFQTP